jgi:AcrR family transcriptional regulator
MNNREHLLTCALDLFAARGYDAVGVQEIAEAASITKPTLYHYFGSKSGLLETLLEENFTALFSSLEGASAYNRNIIDTLNAIAGAYFDCARLNPRFYRLQLSMGFAPPESDGYKAIQLINQRQRNLLEAFFLRAAEDHGNMRGRSQAYAATFLGMLNTHIVLALNGSLALTPELSLNAVRQFMYGIFS